MQGDMVGLVALDFVLRVVPCGVMNVAFPGHVTCVDGDNKATHAAGFRVPAHMVADSEHCGSVVGAAPG
jgi:hypothetical protein